MTIELNLPSDLQNFVAAGARSIGSKPEDYVVLLLRNAQRKHDQAALETKLVEGIESIDRGEGRLITSDYWEGLRAKIGKRFGQEEQ